MLAFEAIVPIKTVEFDAAKVQRQLRAFGTGVVATMQTYPSAKPWKNRPPRTGPRRGGRRTGSYGRSWGMKSLKDRVEIASGLVSRPLKYSGYVGGWLTVNARKGQRQSRVMKQRDWPSIETVTNELWKKHLPKIKKTLQAL